MEGRTSGSKVTALAVLIIIFFSLLYSSIALWDPDFWWHISTGRYIIEHRELPDSDPFSFMPEGSDATRNFVILKGYWLAQLILYGAWSLGGVQGMVIFRTLVLTFVLSLLWWFVRKGRPSLALACLLLSGSVLFSFTGERPQTLVFPLTVLMFMVVQGGIERKNKAFFFLPFITLAWTNLHGSAIFAMGILLLYSVSLAVTWRNRGRRENFMLLLFCLLGVAAAFVSPLGEQRITQFITFQKSIVMSESIEFFSPFRIFSLYGKMYPGYLICLLLTGAVLAVNIRRLPLSTILIVTGSALMSLAGIRYMVFFALSTSLLFREPSLRIKGFFHAAILVLALVPVLLDLGYFRPFHFSLRETYPVESVQVLAEKNPRRLFTYLEWGGFAEYYLPDAKVFIDGRMLNEDTLILYNVVLQGTEAFGRKEWKKNLDENKVDAVMLPLRDFNEGQPVVLVERLMRDKDWEMVFNNGREAAFVRRPMT